MLSARQGELYRDGFAAYDPRGVGGFLQNPFLYGPGREAEALDWWRGYQAARERARLDDPKAAT